MLPLKQRTTEILRQYKTKQNELEQEQEKNKLLKKELETVKLQMCFLIKLQQRPN